ncbi:uncharacterized protein LOC124462201 isoform X2 [Hypomesus transpacificus]|uniref:uncharacterized protein LOC124462201 isoform X2 n=1 Tax=Hypomesus transpacificus TaxID=137520 RepID=UPI001F083DF6|nr:uncharacterized protein LOC124462201 isoform X2 [Hypomesus transpacificus]
MDDGMELLKAAEAEIQTPHVQDLFHEDAQRSQRHSQPWWRVKLFVWEPVLFGTWDGVFTTCMINIFGVVLFLRTGWLVGNTGVWLGMLLVSVVVLVALVTVMSGVGVCERCAVGSGGVYSMISTTLGGRVGGTVGLLYVFGQCVAGAMYITGFSESIAELLTLQSEWVVRGISVSVLLALLGINLAGVKWIVRLQLLLLAVLAISTLDFVIGTFTHLDPEHGFVGYSQELLRSNSLPDYTAGEGFFTVFGVFFPAATGVMAGFNMSADLQRPEHNIPVGTLAAVFTSWFLYLVFVFLLGAICTREALRYDFLIAEKVSLVGFLFLLGLYISSLASCMGGLYGAPRILQVIAQERVIPALAFLGQGKGPNKTPVAAICLTSLLTMAFIFIGQVNILASIVTINFMLTYSFIDYSYFSMVMTYDLQAKERSPGLAKTNNVTPLKQVSKPLLEVSHPGYGTEGGSGSRGKGTLLEFTRDMDQIFPLPTERPVESENGTGHGEPRGKSKRAKAAAKQTLMDSFGLDLDSNASPDERREKMDPALLPREDGAPQGSLGEPPGLDIEQKRRVKRSPSQSSEEPDHPPGLYSQIQTTPARTEPEYQGSEIKPMPDSFYAKFCNHWVALIGALCSVVIMFVIQWEYALANIIVALILFLYIGKTSPGLPIGVAARFSLFTWLRSTLSHIGRGEPRPRDQIVVTPSLSGVGMETKQLTEENVDFASRDRYHQSFFMDPGTGQNMHILFKTDSWTPEESMIPSTEPLSSTVMGTTEATTQWEGQTPDPLTDTYTALPGRYRAVTEEQMLQDSPDTALMLGDSTEMRTLGLSVHTDNDEVKTEMRTVGLSVHTDNDEVKTEIRTVGLPVQTDNDEVKTEIRTVGLPVQTDNDEVKTEMRTVGLNVHTDNDEVRTEIRTVGLPVQTDNDEVKTEMRTVGLNVHTDNDEVRTEIRTVGLPVHTESTYISSTITRAGERTLLSVTSNSTSTYTEDSNPSQSSSWGLTAGVTGSRDHNDRLSSTKADGLDSTSQSHHPANSSYETEGPGLSPVTVPLTGPPSATEQNTTSSAEDSSPNSTPPLDVLDNNTRRQADSADPGHSSGGGTTPAEGEVSSSSSPPAPSTEDRPTNTTQLGGSSSSSIGTSTQSSTGDLGTQSQGRTEGMTSQTAWAEETTRLGLTTTPPRGRDGVTSVDDSLSRFLSSQPPFTPDTPRLGLATEAQATTPSTSTHGTQVTEVDEETHRATAAAETTPTPPLVTTWTVEPPSSSTHLEAHTQRTTPSTTTDSSLGQQASASTSQHQGGSGTQAPTPTQRPSTGTSPTDTTTRHLETSTATPDNHTTHSHHTTALSIRTTPTRSTLAHTTSTSRDTERATTEVGVTTAQMDVRSTPTAGRACSPNPCVNGGMCVTHGETDFTCHCLQAWSGPTCRNDVDECQNDPCPLVSRCVNTRGSFSCECPLGLDLEDGRTCTRAKTFLGTFRVNNPRFDAVLSRSTTLHEIQREILQLLNASLSILPGYSRSTLSKREEDGLRFSAVNMFAASTEVTGAQVYHSIQMTLRNCSSASAHCQEVLHHQLSYHEESLCLAQKVLCDTERSDCSDSSGTAYCRCRPGYFKLNPEDMSCIECGDGSKLENGTCVRCTFGFGGFNCGNFYKLIAVVVSPAGGALLLILIIALIVTCCKKDKNDINKIIFRSGDFQMSPYAEFPKSNPRVSTEWGREAIEMQENGSTKNLLQMTDIYYSPALRNSDLERNGLYPFSGLPGSRHSCIYPAQWNPSFISDDSRRRDYF